MRFYQCRVALAGDRNQEVVKRQVAPAEMMVLRAIHGGDAVTQIQEEPSTKLDRTEHAAVRDHLERQYSHTRVGSENNRQPVLVATFPGWPHVTLPASAEEAGIESVFFAPDAIASRTSGTDTQASSQPQPVGQKTYWYHEDSKEVGVAEKGEYVPAGAKKIKKQEYETLREQLSPETEGEDDGGGEFLQ